MTDLSKAREAYIATMRQDVGKARDAINDAAASVEHVLTQGEPDNGLKDGLTKALKILKEAHDIVSRMEQEHFAGIADHVKQ